MQARVPHRGINRPQSAHTLTAASLGLTRGNAVADILQAGPPTQRAVSSLRLPDRRPCDGSEGGPTGNLKERT